MRLFTRPCRRLASAVALALSVTAAATATAATPAAPATAKAAPVVAAPAEAATVKATAARAPTLANWDTAQQRQVVSAGLMKGSGNWGSSLLAPEQSASLQRLKALLQLTGTYPGYSNAGPAQSRITVTGFDSKLVATLGLSDTAAHIQSVARAAGLAPPSYFGTEIVARFLGLRYNHPSGTDGLELYPGDAITRAEAAWSLAQVLGFDQWSISYAADTLASFELPAMSASQRAVLKIAVSRIGYPYVWGGTTDDTSDGLAHGGFDCSGFAWRVYKVSGLSWGRKIQGRTAAQQAGEISKRSRLRMSQLRPGDLLFFGSARFTSTATESNVIHEGIYLGDNWVIHSSSQGVYVLPLQGSWLGDEFAWGRRVL